MFFISRLIDMLVPDIPTSLEITIKREAYLAKQALAEHHNLMGTSDQSGEELEDEMPWPGSSTGAWQLRIWHYSGVIALTFFNIKPFVGF